METAILVSGLTQALRPDPCARRAGPGGRTRRGARLPRPERQRQDHHHPGAARPAARRRRHGPDARRRPVARRGRPAPPAGVRARRRHAVAEHHRRRGHRPARPDARRAGPAPPRRAAGAVRPRPAQEGPHLLQGQPAEGRAGRRARLGRRAAAARRAHLGPGPADGVGVPAVHPGGEAGGPHGAAVQPHPRRGRGAVRPGEHHPARPHRGDRHAGRAAAPDPDVDRGRDRPAADRHRRRCPACTTCVVEDHHARFDVDTAQLDAVVRRLAAAGRAQPDQHAADAGGDVPAPLRRRARPPREGGRRR